ncbi:MAG: ABC transporter permease [Gemmatimonadales bacterium]|nr:MAG: ABC transporter permease [Gemmatimonadales bacterium]
MDLRQIWILYRHEVRSALRDRSIVVMSIVIPLVMYPLLLWGTFAAMNFVEGQAERLTSRIAVQDAPPAHRDWIDSLSGMGGVSVSEWMDDEASARESVARGRMDAFVRFESPPAEGAGLEQNFQLRVLYSAARDRSERARSQVEEALVLYRGAWIEGAREDLGISDPEWSGFAVVQEDLATPEEATRFLLALMVPMLTLIMVALASFYPAIDATAGERERATWETLMTVSASRGSIAAAKYLHVATFGAMGGLLNVGALVLSLRWILAPVAGPEGVGGGGLPLSTIPIIAVGTVLLGLFVAAGMLVFAIFARNFKEGQAAITPFYMVTILPAIFLQSPDIELTNRLALVPVINLVLLLRSAIGGSLALGPGLLTLASMAVTVVLAVTFAQWVMRREDVLLGSAGAGLWEFLRSHFLRRKGKA